MPADPRARGCGVAADGSSIARRCPGVRLTPADRLARARALLGPDPAAAAALAGPLVGTGSGVAARFVLGAARRRMGEAGAAQAILAPLLAAGHGGWGVAYEAGMAAAALGDTTAAMVALTQAVAMNPASSLAAHALADQRDLAGERATVLPDAATAAAALAWLDGDPAPLAALGLFVTDPAVARLVAAAGLAAGRVPAVEALLTATLAAAPAFHPARLARAAARIALDDRDGAADVARVLAAAPAARTGRMLRAAIAMAAGEVAAAAADFAALTASDTADAAAWHGLGHARRALGDAAGAVAAYRAALAAAPAFAEAWWSLANLKTHRFAAADVAAMTALAARADLPAADRACLRFALGTAADDADEPAAAFAHYAAANAAERARTPFDAAAHHAFVDRTIATLTPAFFAARAGWGDPAADPIFVVGLPRSGSTLVEQILGSHPAVDGLSELSDVTALARTVGQPYPDALADLTAADCAALGADYLARVAPRRRGGARFVDKLPGNVLHLGLINLMLPNACIIDVRRGAMATGWSLFRQRFAAGQGYASDLADIGAYYVDYVRLIDHLAAVVPGRVLTLRYEALVDETEATVRRLLAHARLPFEPAALAFHRSDRIVRTPSSEQVRRPIFRTGLDDWRRYTPWLGPLAAALGPLAADPVTATMPIFDGPIR